MRSANKNKTAVARRLRRSATNAELCLWNRLRARAIDNFKFVRQDPVGPYVVDFHCRERRLVIEVDGGQHADSQSDRLRDKWLRNHNYAVLRFWNNEVIGNIDGVLEIISAALLAEAPPHPVSAEGGNRPLPARGER